MRFLALGIGIWPPAIAPCWQPSGASAAAQRPGVTGSQMGRVVELATRWPLAGT